MRPAFPILLACAPAMLSAAVSGVPEAPRPGTPPLAWLSWGNDAFGGETGANTDDYRTNAFALWLQHDGWIGGADYAQLTDRFEQGTRSDQLNLALGHEWAGDLQAAGQWRLSGGLGLRMTAALGGQWLQDRWHQANGFTQYTLEEDDEETEGTAWMHGEWLLTGAEFGFPDMPWLRPGQLGLALRASGQATTGGELQGSAGLHIVLLGSDGHAMFGLDQEVREGTAPNHTTARTAAHEDGTWLAYAAGAGGWFFQGATGLDQSATWGAIGWQWGRTPGRSAGQTATLEGLFALYQGYALGLQYRWQPEWLAGLAESLSTYVDYRFGRYPGLDWPGTDSVLMRQGLAGVDWELVRLGGQQVSVAPFVQGGAGIRDEQVTSAGNDPHFAGQGALRAVVQGTFGLRMMFGLGTTRLPAYGLSIVYDTWLPLDGAEAVDETTGQSVAYQQSGSALGLRFNARITW